MAAPLPSDLLHDVRSALNDTAAEVVPWFLDQMPSSYFHDIDPETQRTHLAALVGARATGLPPALTLRSADGAQWTVIRPRDRPGLLAELLGELPQDRPLAAAQVHTARDEGLVLDVFSFGVPARFDPADPVLGARLDATLAWAEREAPDLPAALIAETVQRLSAVAVANLSPRRLTRLARLLRTVHGTDDVGVDAWLRSDGEDEGTVTVIAASARPRETFERVAALLGRHGLTVRRAYLDTLAGEPPVTACSFVVRGTEGHRFSPRGPAWEALRRDLLRVPWLDERVLRCAGAAPGLDLAQAEVLVALLDLVHVRLCRLDRYAFSRDRLAALAASELDLFAALADDLLTGADEGAQRLASERRLSEPVRLVANAVAAAVAATLTCNVHEERRYGLALALDPGFLLGPEHRAVPYAVIYGNGRGYRGFHVRFRPIARGGLRVVAPQARDQHALETERLFDEVYGLAFAQLLKNKDIPEGGAKGVVLVEPGGDNRVAVHAFTDGLLDLALQDPDQLLFLGPDENITPELIDWIADRAAVRGYAQPLAFMSSKPGAGINHKRYGVTSEGVAVFLEAALRSRGLDPRTTPFTVKLTGGPDGDVAGNQIRILHRDYGDRARIVGIADGSGSAEDPDGLDHTELLRLVDAEAPIAAFDPTRLGPRGRVVPLEDPDGPSLRNTLHNRLIADVFVPAGGRPRTIDAQTWPDFLTADGAPSSPVIVEGANLFLTPEARTALSARGVSIVKDSSANKCGVICSSFEIAGCLLLDEPGFLRIKDVFVAQVLDRLRALARLEADVLFRTARRRPDLALPELSVRISELLLRATDAVVAALPGVDATTRHLLEGLVFDHLPPVLVEAAGPGLLGRLPPAYVEQTIATVAATRVVYREGLDFLEGLPEGPLAELVIAYVRAEAEAIGLATRLEGWGTEEALAAARLLRRGGARSVLGG